MRPVLRLATRLTRRTRLTMWAVAFACMLLVASLSLVDGLSGGVRSVTSRFDTGPVVYVHGADLLTSSIPADLAGVPGDFQALRVHTGTLTMSGYTRDVVVASLESHRDGNVTVDFPSGPSDAVSLDVGLRSEIQAATGQPVNATVELSMLGVDLPGLPVTAPLAARPFLLPADWAWVRPDLFIAANPSAGGAVQALLADAPLDPAIVSSLGLTTLGTVGAVGFAQGTVAEARAALDVLAVFIAASIALLVYAALSLEVRQREAEIRTLRGIGAAPRTLAGVFLGQAALLAALGASLGSALGIVAAHAVVSFSPILGVPNLVVLPPPPTAVGLAYLVALAASLLGGIVPARRATTVLRGHREAVPS